MRVYKYKDLDYRLELNDYELSVMYRCVGRIACPHQLQLAVERFRFRSVSNLYSHLLKAYGDTFTRNHVIPITWLHLCNFLRWFDIKEFCWYKEEKACMADIIRIIHNEVKTKNPNIIINQYHF